ncbi:hypothetical protein IQ247_00480 [Plectonema cf. radiosum LEGE 06105]|uniref:Uncharacterized protein n=1 Tax=Plectonema cf. radiosum LEGE 06105 TaxID=945769 RepID=A0A8J7EW75_9CYAN|nr:hypothetical protein [Plectonema radiosum]MBE9211206.1 hypothetical protein [Plectonema cf. radiosum LEGE 06105]
MYNKSNQILLLILLIISVVITAFHYTDNFINFPSYPDPEWITPQSIYQSWLILTILGIIGYVLYLNNILWLACVCLSIYSLTGISSPGHYFFQTTETFSFKMHTLIWLDFIAGSLILGFTIWSIGMKYKENYSQK